MYRTCPKCGHSQSRAAEPAATCPACGLVFRKWLKRRYAAAPQPSAQRPARGFAVHGLLHPPGDGRAAQTGRALLWLVLLWLTGVMLSTGYEDLVRGDVSSAYRFLHGIDMVFHEAGHVLFQPFGPLLTALGGSLLQLLVPALAAAEFLRRRDNFGASVALWWCGQSLADLAPYVGDARALRLPLLGGGTGADQPDYHDWHAILARLDALHADRVLAGLANAAGAVCMALALLWGAALLYRQWRGAAALS